ncbi:MAG: LAGLIDADG family homing endonuclease [Candidatus Hodarchaeales archaeon]|jgi:replicative DNA helicase Mcm
MGLAFDIKGRFESFINEFADETGQLRYREKIRNMPQKEQRSLLILYSDLLHHDPRLAREIVHNPEECFSEGEKVLQNILIQIDQDYYDKYRLFHIRVDKYSDKALLRTLKTEHLGLLTSFEGIVIGVTETKPLLIEGHFICASCGHHQVKVFPEGIYNPPYQCGDEHCQRKGSLSLLLDESQFIDWQKITIQERPEELPPGQLPQSIMIHVLDDLVDQARPGDRVEVVGILKARATRILKRGQLATYNKFFQGINIAKETAEYVDIEVTEEDLKQIKELSESPYIIKKIRDSLAPSIYGHDIVKEGIAALLFGGSEKLTPDGMKIRGESNILLIGDPGVGKCVVPETEVILSSGERFVIGEFVDQEISGEFTTDDGYYQPSDLYLKSLNLNAQIVDLKSNLLWKRKSPQFLFLIKTQSGRRIKVTPTHPFFICKNGKIRGIAAKDLRTDEFLAVPRKVRIKGRNHLNISYQKSQANNAVRLKPPSSITPWFAEFLGLYIAEGSSQDQGKSKTIWFTNSDQKLLLRFRSHLNQLGVNFNQRKSSKKTAWDIYSASCELFNYLKALEPRLVDGSKRKRVPNPILRATDDIVAIFLRALFDGEAHIANDRPKIEFASASYKLLKDIQYLLLRFEIISHIKEKVIHGEIYYRLNITGIQELRRYSEKIGFSIDYKNERLRKVSNTSKVANTNTDIIPNVGDLIKKIRLEAELYQRDFSLSRSAILHYERKDSNPSRENLQVIVKDLIDRKIWSKELDLLEKLSFSEVYWDRIEEITQIPSDTDWVYDLQVPEVHNFIADGFIVHNSQLLKFVSKLAPRALYTTGKGSTAAGLTAAVIRDQDTGEITLEAGALVLADQGIAMVDEFDKMRPDDRTAIHEAMEQHTISIAKAGIVATLNARTSILAAANPRRGRWNPYKATAENLNLPPTILSRFDLIFVLEDKPDLKEDHDRASHILKLHKLQTLPVDPPIEQTLLRKYIAHARRTLHPKLTDEAEARLLEYYTDLRSSSGKIEEGRPDPIAITPRQLEALVRLSEARAKMRLSEEVSYEDASGAVNLMNATLEKLAKDAETGKLDIDKYSSGLSDQSRRRLDRIDALIDNMLKESENEPIAINSIINQAVEDGLDRNQVEQALAKMIRIGKLFEPQPGRVQKI